MTRRALAAWAAEIPDAARGAFGTATTCAGLLLGLWLIWFTPAGPAVAGAW